MPRALRDHLQLLRDYVKPQGWRVVGLAVLLLGGIALQLLSPQIIRNFIDTAQAGAPLRVLTLAALAYLGIGLAGRVLALAAPYAGQQVAWRATNALRTDLLRHVLRLDMPFHKTHTPGELIERIDGDASALGELFSQMTVKVAGNALLVVAIAVLLYRESALAGLLLTLYCAVVALVLLAPQRAGAQRWAAARQAWAEQTGFLEEHIAGAEDIRGVGAERHALRKLGELTRQVERAALTGRMFSALGLTVTSLLQVISYGLGLTAGALLYLRGEATIGTAFLIVTYIGMLAAPLDELRHQAGALQEASGSVARICALLALRPQVTDGAGAELPPGALGVTAEGVSFAYRDDELPLTDDGRPAVLREVAFALAPGRVLGVLGRTGSGKTTLARLLFRLYDPDTGTLRLGGADLRMLRLADLRRRVGLVTQEVQLFGASVRDNIRLFDPNVSDAAIRSALAELDMLEWVEALPGGLDAELAADGGGMSAGEAQLLACARLLLGDPGLVILDEASARLDPLTETRLERALGRMLGQRQRTAIVIAHRLSTVQLADDILILEDGRVVEYGPRAALAADAGSHFAGLLRTGLADVLG